jgi:putative oxidoreductase
VTEGGYEYNLVLLATIFALTEAGHGSISLDRALGTERCGTAWALGQLAAGAAGSAAISKLPESRASAEVEAREERADRAEASAHAPA